MYVFHNNMYIPLILFICSILFDEAMTSDVMCLMKSLHEHGYHDCVVNAISECGLYLADDFIHDDGTARGNTFSKSHQS